MYQSILGFRKGRYFWIAALLGVLCTVAYFWHDPIDGPNGGTWLGYTLGTIGAILIIWLSMLGIRKRSYSSSVGSMQGWTSAHVYLGSVLVLVASLHSGWQFGYNIHTLAYALMVAVIVSGFYGLYAYVRYPSRMSDNRAGDTLADLLLKVEKLDKRALNEASTTDLRALVVSMMDGTHIGGSVWQQLAAKDKSVISIPASLNSGGVERKVSNGDQVQVIECLADRLSVLTGGEEAGSVQNLLASVAARQTVLRRIRRDVQIRALLKIWLYFHVPLSIALLAALSVHIVVVFFYW